MRTIKLDNSDSASTLLAIDVRRTIWFCERGPQNPDIPSITDQVNDILSKKACVDFANRILNAVSTADNPLLKGRDLKEVFKDFLSQKKGGYTRKKPATNAGYGSATGLISKGNATIFSRAYGKMTSEEQTAYDAATTVAELFHMAGQNEYYTDRALAEAAQGIPEYASQMSLSPQNNVFHSGNASDRYDGGYSSYFHNIARTLYPVAKP